jgi:hypothetical protein
MQPEIMIMETNNRKKHCCVAYHALRCETP